MPQRKSNSKTFGGQGEDHAVHLLRQKGYRIIDRNFRTRFAEIDIIAIEGDTLVFVEVKTRSSVRKGLPQEAVNAKKLERIRKAAEYFLRKNSNKRLPKKHRIDVVAIIADGNIIKSAEVIKVG